jgi:hypothetical protein
LLSLCYADGERRGIDGRRRGAGTVASMSWALWLATPIVMTVLGATWSWWRGRPQRVPGTDEAMRAHQDYLDALVRPARGIERTQPR